MDIKNEGLSTFPKELLAEILCKLPVKSLMRLTCVCKTWLSIIMHDPHFAIKQYIARTTSSSNVLDSADFILSWTSYGRPSLYSLTAAKTYKYLNKYDCVPDMAIGGANPCNGILCFYLVSRSQVLLCNPLIREVVLLPPCPSEVYPIIGYDTINDDYKVVTISRKNDFTVTVNVYSVRQGYWRSLHVSNPLHPDYYLDIFSSWALNANGRMHNHLFCEKLDYWNVSKGLLCFDMADEVFNVVPMPECEIYEYHKHELLSSTKWEACLSCVPKNDDFDGRYVDIWVLNNRVWSKVFGVRYPGLEPMKPSGFWLNDKEMFVIVKSTNTKEVFHYDLDTQQLTRTGRCRSVGRCYVGSLVSIKHYLTSISHECEHGEGDNQNDGQDKDGGFTFRAVSRKGVRWFHSF